jgi:hypothetical protein
MPRPHPDEYAPFYAGYVSLVPEEDVLPLLAAGREATARLLDGVGEAEGDARHAPYTWSVKEVVGHLIDGERIFGYRALRFARGDATDLPGFDENAYVAAGRFDRLALADLAAEFAALRRSHELLFAGLPPEAWGRRGVANGAPVSVRALATILVGHERHHAAILARRLGREAILSGKSTSVDLNTR